MTDSNKYARASLVSVIIPFCYMLPHQIVIDHILSCILKILKDEYPNVRLHVISNICDHETEREEDDSATNHAIEYEEVTIEIDANGNEIKEIMNGKDRMDVDVDGKERKYKTIKRKKKPDDRKKFDISLLEESIIP